MPLSLRSTCALAALSPQTASSLKPTSASLIGRLAHSSSSAKWQVGTRHAGSWRLACRATLEAPERAEAPAREDSSSSASSTPSCCSSSDEGLERTASAEGSSAAVLPSPSNQGLQRALLVGSLLAVAGAGLATYSGLLPLDFDSVQDWLDEAVYFLGQEINGAVSLQLNNSERLAPGLLGLVFGAGLITSFAPCTLSVLPLTIGYIAGFNNDKSEEEQTPVLVNALFFALGLASTFSALGITAALAGKAYGQMGPGLPMAVSGVTMYMGLNLLGLAKFQVPSLFANFDAKEAAASLPGPVQMYLGGMTFALLASPCSTPVLASLLGYVASSEVRAWSQ